MTGRAMWLGIVGPNSSKKTVFLTQSGLDAPHLPTYVDLIALHLLTLTSTGE